MSPEQTIEKMKTMKLSPMVEAYEHQLANPSRFADMGFDERLAMLVDHESDVRRTKKIERLINESNMYFKAASPEQISYDPGRGLDKSLMARILDCTFIGKSQNVILQGASASGKTWLSCAIGVAACRAGYKVRYYKMRNLIDELMVSRAALDGSYQKMIAQLKKTPLVIIDDFLLHEVSSDDMGELLELVDARLLTGSTILCSQYKHDGWIKIMGRSAISEALMSRIKSSSHVIEIKTTNDMRLENSELL